MCIRDRVRVIRAVASGSAEDTDVLGALTRYRDDPSSLQILLEVEEAEDGGLVVNGQPVPFDGGKGKARPLTKRVGYVRALLGLADDDEAATSVTDSGCRDLSARLSKLGLSVKAERRNGKLRLVARHGSAQVVVRRKSRRRGDRRGG